MNYADLAHQIALQKKHAWDLEADIPWHLGIDTAKFFLPLDDQSIAFPGASAEQQLALSQFMGLVVNATISEMEDALPKLKYSGWQKLLDEYPVGPEIVELGEMFFEEEAKHARAFGKFLDIFCNTLNVEREELDSLLPKAYGSNFQRAITQNAYHGGHAFWWVVASVEEVSISIYHQIFRHRQHIDPLFFQLHRRHLEEESRHANYAFLMLNLVSQKPTDIRTAIHRKVDFIISQLVGAPWVITELYKFFNVKELRHRHPFFEVLASCVPLYEKMSKPELIKRMFLAAPYISWLLNPKWRKLHLAVAKDHGAIVPPFPQPITPTLTTVTDS